MDNSFKIVVPAEIYKSKSGEYKIGGLASTNSKDLQGEMIMQKGIDLTPVEEGRGFFNFDHSNKPEDTIGIIEGYKQGPDGLYVHGSLFKGHQRAEAVYAIMKALKDKKSGAVGMSVEGKILERDPVNPKIIKKCQIKNVAITFNPVNQDTHAELLKSLSHANLEFDAPKAEGDQNPETASFTAEQVVEIIQKALAVSGNYGNAPANQLTGGDALSMEALDKKPKKVEKPQVTLKPGEEELAKDDELDEKTEIVKSGIKQIFEMVSKLHPGVPKDVLWDAVKDRLQKKYNIGAN